MALDPVPGSLKHFAALAPLLRSMAGRARLTNPQPGIFRVYVPFWVIPKVSRALNGTGRVVGTWYQVLPLGPWDTLTLWHIAVDKPWWEDL